MNNKSNFIFGGSLENSPVFNKILSIGFEFESSTLTKFSLQLPNKNLINSNLSVRSLKEKIEENMASNVDYDILFEKNKMHKSNELNPPVVGKNKNYVIAEIEQQQDDLTEEEKEFMKYFKDDNIPKYLEYYYENRKNDNRKNVKFEITNDNSDDDFIELVRNECTKLNPNDPPNKDDMYIFKLKDSSKNGKTFNLTFANEHSKCFNFSTLEMVVTYYKPKNSKNKIFESFVDACSRIIDHMGNLERMNGELMIIDKSNSKFKPILKNIYLLHKPSTNLYYMSKKPNSTINDIVFVPQMTFRSHAVDTIDIMREILKLTPTYEKSAYNEYYQTQYDVFIFIEGLVDDILKTTKIDTSSIVGKKIRCYFFLILFKLEMFINYAHNIIVDDVYLKNFLYFNSRHFNLDLYKRIKFLIKKHYDSSQLKLLFHQPEAFRDLFDFDDDKKMFQEDAFKKILQKNDKNYGNPLYSIDSYFKYLEEKHEDWFYNEQYDQFSTIFDIKTDIILIEHRVFHIQLNSYLKNFIDNKIIDEHGKNYLFLDEMKRIVAKSYEKTKIKEMINYDFIKNRLTKKCKKGFLRTNKSIKCIKSK